VRGAELRRRDGGGCGRTQVGKSTKEMDSLLLRTALDSHEAERGAASRAAAGRSKQRASVETFADLRSKHKDKDKVKEAAVGSSPRGQPTASARAATERRELGTDSAHEQVDWRMRPANVDTAYIPGKVAPLGEYDATQRNPGMRAAGLSSTSAKVRTPAASLESVCARSAEWCGSVMRSLSLWGVT
jgi:hypothetical protein